MLVSKCLGFAPPAKQHRLRPRCTRGGAKFLPVYYRANTGDVTKCQPGLYVLKSGNFECYISDLIQATLGYFRT